MTMFKVKEYMIIEFQYGWRLVPNSTTYSASLEVLLSNHICLSVSVDLSFGLSIYLPSIYCFPLAVGPRSLGAGFPSGGGVIQPVLAYGSAHVALVGWDC